MLATIDEAYREALREWTEWNVGLPVAIVRKGMYRNAPILLSPLEDHLQINFGPWPEDDVRADAEDVACMLTAGKLPVPLRLRSVEER